MADNGGVWKSDYPRKHFAIFGISGLLLGLGIIVLEATMIQFREDLRLNDFRYNQLLPIAIAGLIFGVYFIVMAILTAVIAKSRSRCLSIFFLILSIVGLCLDLALISYHGLHLIMRCNPNEFEGINNLAIRSCRNEIDNVLLIVKHGTAILLVIISTTIHAVINLCSIITAMYAVCRSEQV